MSDHSVATGPVHELPIGILHLGTKTNTLKHAGFGQVGDLGGDSSERIRRLPSIGKKTVDLLQTRLQTLFACANEEGSIDYERYFSEIQIPLIPKSNRPKSGEEFLFSLPLVFNEVAEYIGDPIAETILQKRLCKAPGEQMTLDQIAQEARPILTRERIRQIEKKLLGRMVDGLLNDNYTTLGIHFHPNFSRWWRRASEALTSRNEITATDFLGLLASVWHVSQAEIIEQLPIILAIVTGQSNMPTEFRSIQLINPMWYGPLDSSLRKVPVRCLRIGRYADQLIGAGYVSLGDVAGGIQSGEVRAGAGNGMDSFLAHLNFISSCIGKGGSLRWDKYQHLLGLERLPGTPPESAVQFVHGLGGHLERLLERTAVTKRSVQIYRLRVQRNSRTRKTLHQTAEILKTHPPTIKREETVLLKFLNDALIFGEFSNLPVWLDEQWLGYWSEASSVFERSDGDYRTFSGNLAWRWRLTEQQMRQAAPSVWAVLNGYPDGRPRRRAGIQDLEDAGEPVGRIKLRGFRRVH